MACTIARLQLCNGHIEKYERQLNNVMELKNEDSVTVVLDNTPLIDKPTLDPVVIQSTPHEQTESIQYCILVCCAFTLSTVCMILLNKTVVSQLDFASLTLIMQNTVLLIMLKIWRRDLTYDLRISLKWFPCALLFCCNIFTSMQSLRFLSVPTFTVMRNLQALFSCPLDWAVRGTKSSYTSMFFIVLIFAGVCVYHMDKWQSDTTGICWALVHILSLTLYAVCVKVQINTLELDAFEMSMYNAVWSTLLLIPLACYQTHAMTEPINSMVETCAGNVKCWGSLLLSCICCFAVSVTGFSAHTIMSPVSFVTFNNVNKLPATALAYVIWPTEVSWVELFGMMSALWGGYGYAISLGEGMLHPAWLWISGGVLVCCVALIAVYWMA